MKLYELLPAVIRFKDKLASQLDSEELFDFPVVGLDPTYKGRLVVYQYLGTTLPALATGTKYYLRWLETKVGGDTTETGVETWVPGQDVKRSLDTFFRGADDDLATDVYHITLEIHKDVNLESLVYTTDTSLSTSNWFTRPTATLEKILGAIEDELNALSVLAAKLSWLSSPTYVDFTYLPLLSYLVGANLPSTLSELVQREFLRNVVSLYKQKGTVVGWERYGFTQGLQVKLRELFKTQYSEIDNYFDEQSDSYPYPSARIDIMTCETQCETFEEPGSDPLTGSNLSGSEAFEVFNQLRAFMPVHVHLRPHISSAAVTDTFPTTQDTLGCYNSCEASTETPEGTGSIVRALFDDEFPEAQDELTSTVSCVTNCMLACQTCCEVGCMTDCQLGPCETQACQAPAEVCCQQSCEYQCQASCTNCFNCQLNCQQQCQQECMVFCQGLCQGSGCQQPCQANCQTGCEQNCEVSCTTVCEDLCQGGCQISCTVSCEVSCMACCEVTVVESTTPGPGHPCGLLCEIVCQSGCEASCTGACTTACQLTCEVEGCQNACELECMTGCEVNCQNSCMSSCQLLCESQSQVLCDLTCQGYCETNCEHICLLSCQVTCMLVCQFRCQYLCETGCEVSCEEGACETSCTADCEMAAQ